MGAISGSASTEIDAPIEAVWALVQDVESAPSWQRGIDATDALERDGDGRATSCETVTDAKIKVFKARVSFDYAPPARLSWVQEQGDLKSMTGSWQLEQLDAGRTRATYALQADPGALLSRFIKGALEQKMRAILIEGRPAELKARAEAAVRAGAAEAG
jgi:carbon monoxide dehydrogenase subunit G